MTTTHRYGRVRAAHRDQLAPTLTRRVRAAAVAVAAALMMTAGAGLAHAAPTDPGAATEQWSAPGPHPVDVRVEPVTTFYFPTDLAADAPAPVVIWGNGSGGVPGVYSALLRHWASYGFIVAAANTPMSNTGIEMRAGLDRLTALDADPTSVFHDVVDLSRVTAAGHSQGGAGAIVAGADARVTSVMALQPGPVANVRALHSPLLLLAGSDDRIVPPWAWILPVFYPNSPGPTVYASLGGAGHFSSVLTPQGGVYRSVTTAWLLDAAGGDPSTRAVFHSPRFTLGQDSAWVDVRRNAAALNW